MLSYCHDLICYTYVLAMYYPYTIDMLVTHYLAPHTPHQGQNVQTISYIEPPTYSLQDHDHDVGVFLGFDQPTRPTLVESFPVCQLDHRNIETGGYENPAPR